MRIIRNKKGFEELSEVVVKILTGVLAIAILFGLAFLVSSLFSGSGEKKQADATLNNLVSTINVLSEGTILKVDITGPKDYYISFFSNRYLCICPSDITAYDKCKLKGACEEISVKPKFLPSSILSGLSIEINAPFSVYLYYNRLAGTLRVDRELPIIFIGDKIKIENQKTLYDKAYQLFDYNYEGKTIQDSVNSWIDSGNEGKLKESIESFMRVNNYNGAFFIQTQAYSGESYKTFIAGDYSESIFSIDGEYIQFFYTTPNKKGAYIYLNIK